MPRTSTTSRPRRPRAAHIAAAAAVSLAAVLAYHLLVSFLPDAGGPALVRDDANLLAPVERRKLAEFHRYLLNDHDVDYRVVTVAGAGDLSRFAVKTFGELDVGGQSQGQRGLLLVIDPAAGRVRLEVGRALEGSFPDAFVAYVEERQMVPFFRSARVSDGVLATTELIVQRIQGEKRSGGFQDHIAAEGTAGGGAETAARIGEGVEDAGDTDRSASSGPAAQGATGAPRAVVDAYLEAMADRNSNPGLPIYTGETQRMLQDWTVTPAQMDSVVRTYRRCAVDRVFTSGSLAVVRYDIRERACAPFFLRREGGSWRLDLTMMQTAVRFGRNNSWRLDPAASHPYGFAFSDWRFHSNGFPVGER